MRLRSIVSISIILLLAGSLAYAQKGPESTPTKLPRNHEYQQVLCKFLGSLTEKDFDHGVTQKPEVAPTTDPDETYRTWLLTLEFPRVGRKRSHPSVNLLAKYFTLAAIEDPEKGVQRPSCWPEPTAWLANWKYAGNPYYGSRALKLRAFVTATVLMLMMDDLQEHPTGPRYARSDWSGPSLIAYAYTYDKTRDVIPAEARAAFETCLKQMMQRVSNWGPKGDETHFDISAVLGMRLAADVLKDPESAKLAESYARRVFSDEQFYNPAGYFPDQRCFDVGYQGMSLYWGTWLALAAPDWPFVQDAVKKAWRLRGYMALPDPDGAMVGPTHFNSRTSSDVHDDQWDWPFRPPAAAFLTDDAAAQAKIPDEEQLKEGPAAVVAEFRAQLAENAGMLPAEKLGNGPWQWSLWPDSPQFPMNNYAFDYYPKGYAAHVQELQKKNSPLLKCPFQRDGSFTEAFEKVFLMAKRPTFGAIVHTGPVSEFPGGERIEFLGPYGLSGGSLSAFWTPATGSVILGRRGGMTFPNHTPPNWDTLDKWRLWPVHAVAGQTAAGKVFTSARIQNPAPVYELNKDSATVRVAGVIPSVTFGSDKSLEGRINYARTFELDEKGLRVETRVSGDGKDEVAELYEVLPVFLREASLQQKATPTAIEFQAGGNWVPATTDYQEKVTAVKLTRFGGAVQITFDRPIRVKLSPAEWKDTYMSGAVCRNVMIDLLEGGPLTGERTLRYSIAPAAK